MSDNEVEYSMSKNKNDGIKRNDPFKVQTIEISDDFNTAVDKAFCSFSNNTV